MDKADELAGEHNGQKRVDDLAKGDVSQRQRENDEVAEKIHPLDADLEMMRKAERKRVIAGRGGVCADTQADANADKCGACNGGRKRHLCDLRPERREALENGVEQ